MADRRAWRGFWIVSGIAATWIGIGLVTAVDQLGAASIPIWLGTLGAGWLVARGPIGQAVLHRLTEHTADDETRALSADTLHELDALRQRVMELEERVDFAERLLPARGAGGAPQGSERGG